MADPQGKEDVLSSIRRLVTDEVAPDEAAPDKTAPETTKPTPPDRLVLAPDARVSEPEDPYQAIRALAQEELDARDADTFAPDTGRADLTEDLVARAPAPPRWDAPETADPAAPLRLTAPSRSAVRPLSNAELDALRDIVADVVRQELSGALGERITRNVRKLVRRELRNAMGQDARD